MRSRASSYHIIRQIDNWRPGVAEWRGSFEVALPERRQVKLHVEFKNGRLTIGRPEFTGMGGGELRERLSLNDHDVYMRDVGNVVEAWCRRTRRIP